MTRDAHFSINKVVCCFRWLSLTLTLSLTLSPPLTVLRYVVLLCFAVNANVIWAEAAAEALSLQQTLHSPVKVDVSWEGGKQGEGRGRKHKRERTSTIAYVMEPALEIVLVIVAIIIIIIMIILWISIVPQARAMRLLIAINFPTQTGKGNSENIHPSIHPSIYLSIYPTLLCTRT